MKLAIFTLCSTLSFYQCLESMAVASTIPVTTKTVVEKESITQARALEIFSVPLNKALENADLTGIDTAIRKLEGGKYLYTVINDPTFFKDEIERARRLGQLLQESLKKLESTVGIMETIRTEEPGTVLYQRAVQLGLAKFKLAIEPIKQDALERQRIVQQMNSIQQQQNENLQAIDDYLRTLDNADKKAQRGKLSTLLPESVKGVMEQRKPVSTEAPQAAPPKGWGWCAVQ